MPQLCRVQTAGFSGHDRTMSSSDQLLAAAKNGYYAEVAALLVSGVRNVDARDKDQATPLYWSASRGHLQICEALIRAGCDVNACVKWGSTALHAAADRGHAECLNLLIASGTDVNVQNARGDSALHLAAYRGFKEIALRLTQAGADPFTKNAQSKTALQEAQSQQHAAAAAVLQQYMEKFGLHTFKSLPESHLLSKMQQQQQHHFHHGPMVSAAADDGSSEPFSVPPAQSWPRYQSFHKLPSENGSKSNIPEALWRCELGEPWPPQNRNPHHHHHHQQYNDLSADSNGKLQRDSGEAGAGGEGKCEDGLEGFVDMCGRERWQEGVQGGGKFEHTGRASPLAQRQVSLHLQLAGAEERQNDLGYRRGQDQVVGGAMKGGCDNVRSEKALKADPLRVSFPSTQALLRTHPDWHEALSNGAAGHPSQYHQHLDISAQDPGQQGSRNGLPAADLEMAPPVMAPPGRERHHRSNLGAGFVSLEDLTQFAESLQLEIVNLRDALTGKEQRVSELQALLLQLQSEAGSQQRRVEDLLASRDNEVGDVTRRLSLVERQNVELRDALTQQHTRWKQAADDNDCRTRELILRVRELELLNSRLQQVIVSQQDSMARLQATKDDEISHLKNKLQVQVAQRTAASPGTPVKQQRCSVAGDSLASDWTRVVPAGNRDEKGGSPGPAQMDPTTPEEPAANHRPAQHPPSTAPSSSATSFSDPYSSTLRDQTRMTQSVSAAPLSPSGVYSSHSPAPAMASTFGGGDTKLATAPGGSAERYPGATGRALHSGASPAFGDPDSQQLLKARVAQLVRGPPAEAKLDADGREWTVGREFALLDPNPVNCGGAEGQRRGSNSLVFSIAHNGRKYVLKMLINLINLTQEAHTVSGRSLDAHLLHRFGAEFHAPLLLRPPHPNVVHVRHHYQGDTTPFRGYLPLLVPEGLDVAVEMAGRTTFLVLDHYPETLPSLLSAWQGRGAAATPSHGDSSRASGAGGGQEGLARLPEQFVLQLTYQLLSAVEYLRSQGVVHRDIKGDNVFLDRRLRPVLGDFGFARTLRGFSGEAMPLTCSDQVYAGNPGAWAPELCRLSRADLQTLPRTATLEDVYSKSDAYAVSRMLYHLLDTPGSPALPTSTSQRPHYPDSAVPLLGRPVGGSLAHVLRNLVLDDPAQRLTARQALLSVGVILCRSSGADLSTPQSAQDFCSSRLMALAALANQTSNDSSEHSTLSVTDSVTVNQNYCLADCLLRFTGSDLWGAYQETASLTH